MEEFIRSEMLLGKEAMHKLKKARVIVFGAGGVGSYVIEALARGGVGSLTIVDHDTVSVSNINRQLCALHSTIGSYKAEVMAERVRDINPDIAVTPVTKFFLPENRELFDVPSYDYIVDAIDTVTAKLALAELAWNNGKKIISSMGTGNKLNGSAFEICDISETSVCPLARVMRRELKQRGVQRLKVLYSREQPLRPQSEVGESSSKRQTPGSVSFVPSAAGLMIAGEVIKDLILEG